VDSHKTGGDSIVSEKSKSDISIILVIIIIIICIVASHWYFANVYSEDEYTFHYLVKIGKFADGNSTVIIPFPVFSADNEHWQNEIFNNLDLDMFGGEVELIETEYGLGLKATLSPGYGTLFYETDKQVPPFSLTLNHSQKGISYQWINYETEDNRSIDVHLQAFYGHRWRFTGNELYNTTYVSFRDLSADWQSIDDQYWFSAQEGWNPYRVYTTDNLRWPSIP